MHAMENPDRVLVAARNAVYCVALVLLLVGGKMMFVC